MHKVASKNALIKLQLIKTPEKSHKEIESKNKPIFTYTSIVCIAFEIHKKQQNLDSKRSKSISDKLQST